MKVYRFDLDVDAWIKNVEVVAETKEEAIKKLNSMSCEELIEDGYVHDFSIKEIEFKEEY